MPFHPGDKVHVAAFRTMPAFNGVIIEKVGVGYNVKHPDGTLWFRDEDEMRRIDDELQTPLPSWE